MGRLKPGVSLAQANAAMDVVARRLAEDRPASNGGQAISVEPLQNNFLPRRTVVALWLLLGAVAFVLLIACANVANLMLARSTTRAREIAVRASLGAGRRRLVQQLMTESLLLAVLGGLLGVALAVGLLHAILAIMPPDTLPLEADVRVNLPVLAFTVLASLVAAVLFGCIPAWQASRIDINTVLKETAPAAAGGRQGRLRRGLVAVEFALALTLLAGGGLALHGFVKLLNVELGFQREHLLTFGLPVPAERLANDEQTEAFYRDLLGRVRAVPGVTSVAVSTGIPVYGMRFEGDFQIVGQPASTPAPRAGVNMVTPEYFTTMGIRLRGGRAFDERDRAGSPRVAIVNEAFARRYFGGQDPLGQRLRMASMGIRPQPAAPVEWEVVGVSADVRNAGPRVALPEIDVPFWQDPWPASRVTVRTAGSPTAPRAAIADIVRALDPDLPMADAKTMDQMVGQEVAADRFHAVLFGGFAGLALLLAALGVYGAMSFAVAQRTHEIGLRMALGAERGQVLRLVLREGLATALTGWLVGLGGAYVVGRAMQGMWYEVGALDPTALAAVSALLMGSAVLACLVPARRAASVDPIAALRQP
jgi:putative ABC transport system permease protein